MTCKALSATALISFSLPSAQAETFKQTVSTITGGSKPVYRSNATGATSVVTELESSPKSIEAFNVYGEPVKIDKPAKGLNRISIPQSGYAILRY